MRLVLFIEDASTNGSLPQNRTGRAKAASSANGKIKQRGQSFPAARMVTAALSGEPVEPIS